MADSDRILKILLQLQADLTGSTQMKGALDELSGKLTDIQKIQAWGNYLATAKQAKTATDDVAKSAFSLEDAFKFAGAEEALRRVIDLVKEVPNLLEDGLKTGIEFNAELQQIQIAFAAVLQQTQGSKFGDFASAKAAAADYIDTVKEKANELGIAYTAMFESVQHTQAQLANAGVTDINKAIDLTVLLNRALQSVGVEGTRAARDIGDILQGRAAQTLGGPRLAGLLGMNKEDFDLFLQQAIQTGTLYDQLKSKLSTFSTAAQEAAGTFTADTTRMKNAVLDLESEAAKPIMAPLQEAIEQFTASLHSDDAKAWADVLGNSIVQLTLGLKEAVTDITQLTQKYQNFLSLIPGVANVMQGVGAVGGALGAAHDSAVDVEQTNELQKQLDLTKQRVAAASTEGEKSVQLLGVFGLQAEVEQKINDEKAKGAQADQGILSQLFGILDQVKEIRVGFDQIAGSANNAAGAIRSISPALQKLQDQQALFHAETYGNDADVYRAKWMQTYDSIAEEAKRAGQALTNEEINQLTYERLRGPERQKELADAQKEVGVQKDITAAIREQETVLQGIRQQQQLITANTFLSSDQKESQSLQSMIEELQQLKTIYDDLQSKKQGPLDPAQLEQINQKIQQTQFEFDLLRLKIQALQQPLLAGLAQWANSFGSTIHQVWTAITGTLNTAISGTSQALTGLITGTKNWQQAFAQAGSSIIESLIRMALQFVVSRLLMSAINRAMGSADSSAATSQASEAAAAWAPAATSASIASYGTAAGTGLAAYLAALASGVAGATALAGVGGGAGGAGFESGGYTGDAGGIVHAHEYVFNKTAVRNIGLDNLHTLHQTAQGIGASSASGGGGGVGGSSAHAFFFDRDSAVNWLMSHPAMEKHITDVVHRKRVQLGIRS